jgi:hypothetical protein
MHAKLLERTCEFLWLREAKQRVAALPPGLVARVRAEVEAAVDTMQMADRAPDPKLRLETARRALSRLFVAFAAARDGDARHLKATTSGAPEQTLAVVQALPGAPRHGRSIAWLARTDPAEQGGVTYRDLARLFAWVENRLDVRTGREIMLTSLARCLAVALTLFALYWLPFGAHNVAQGKHVTSSSVCGAVPTLLLGARPLYRAVDGFQREQSFAVCTEKEVHPWIAVDLAKPYNLDEVVVYARNDCCWGEDDLPLSLQTSLDNEHFVTIAQKTEPFSAEFPWGIKSKGVRGRYVRLISEAPDPRQLFVGEIEVYGR